MIRTKFPKDIMLPDLVEKGTLLRSRTGAIIQIKQVRMRNDLLEYEIVHVTKYGTKAGGHFFSHMDLVRSGCVLVNSTKKEDDNAKD